MDFQYPSQFESSVKCFPVAIAADENVLLISESRIDLYDLFIIAGIANLSDMFPLVCGAGGGSDRKVEAEGQTRGRYRHRAHPGGGRRQPRVTRLLYQTVLHRSQG